MPPKLSRAPPPPPPTSQAPRKSVGGGIQATAAAPARPLSLKEQLACGPASLRSVPRNEVHDSSEAAATTALSTPEDFSDYQKYMQCFNVECWLEALGDATFGTELVPVEPADAEAIIALHKRTAAAEVLASASDRLARLVPRLQRAMELVGASQCGCFVKTSSRSAKDHVEPASIRSQVNHSLQRLECSDENAQLIALSYASMRLLCMSEAQQVVHVLVESERCLNDMELALAQRESWNESLVARRWVHLEPDMEFRCFVSGNELNAVSQYRHLVHFPRLLFLRDDLLEGLKEFFHSIVQPRLAGVFPRDQYVADVAVELVGGSIENVMANGAVEGLSLGRWWCIEVNPFYETTDGCLFSWQRERLILEGGCEAGVVSGPHFRLRERPAKGALAMVYSKWREALGIDEAVQKVG